MALKTRKPTGQTAWPRILVEGGEKTGKAQPLHARIVTPTGWTTMGQLRAGDQVVGSDGLPSVVSAVYERGERDIYRLTFSDGATVEACDEHLWATRTSSALHRRYGKGPKKGQRNHRPLRIRTTAELRQLVLNGTVVHIPMTAPVQYNSGAFLPFDPYALGLLLGDGGLSKRNYPTFTSGDPELFDALAAAIPAGDTLTYLTQQMTGIKGGRTTEALRGLGLVPAKSADKFIPDAYMTTPVADRLALLQGLMDTDGGMEWKSITFTSVSFRLASQVQELVQSLGGSCSMRSKQPSYRRTDGTRVECQTAYRLTMRLPLGFCPFRLSRKVQRWTDTRPTFITPPRRTVKAVEYVGRMPARCITVNADDCLYLTDGFVVTHNSWTLAELSASPRIGRTLVLPLGEDVSKWDEYGLIPGARFEIIEHDGSWASIMDAAESAKQEAAKAVANGEKPWVFGFDTMTAEWEGLKDWGSRRARSSEANKKLLARDPNAEIVVSPNYWNDAHRRHRQLMTQLLLFPGIVVLLARGKEVTFFQNGQPVAGKTAWKVEAEDSVPFDITAHIRLKRDEPARLISAFGVHVQVKPGKPGSRDTSLPMSDGWTLDSFIFDTLKLDPAAAAIGGVIEMQTSQTTPEQILEEARRPDTTFARVKELHAEAYQLRYDGVILPDERGQDQLLFDQLVQIGKAKQQAEQRAAAERADRAREQALKALDPDDSWLIPVSTLTTLADEETLRDDFLKTFGSKPDSDPRKKALLTLLDLKRAELRRAQAGTAPGKTAAPAPGAPATSPPAVTPEEFVRQFRERLAATGNDPDEFGARRDEINKALAARIIPARVVSELHEEVTVKARSMRGATDAAPDADGQDGTGAAATEDEWIVAFAERVAATNDSAGIRTRRAEVARAASVDKIIGPQTANELFADIKKRDAQIRSAA